MIIEQGKYYLSRDGKRVGPIAPSKSGPNSPFPWTNGTLTYTATGSFYAGGRANGNDLVEEYPGPLHCRIEDGKFYRTRDGRKVGPMVKTAGFGYWAFSATSPDGKNVAWRWNGSHSITPGRSHPFDLVAEWVDNPEVLAAAAPAIPPPAPTERAQTFEERERDLLEANVRMEQRARDAEAKVRDLTALIAGKAEEQGDTRIVLDLEGGLPDRWDHYAAAGTFFLGLDARAKDRARLAAEFADAMMAEREKRGQA